MNNTTNTPSKLIRIGEIMIRYGLVLILLWVGALKFLTYEAQGIKPLVENSGLMSWGYDVMSIQQFAIVIGVMEIIIALLIAMRFVSPKISAVGSIGAIFMFIVTISFLFTTPGVWQQGEGFPYPSPMPGQFLAKDLMLLAASIWTAGEALIAARRDKN